MYMYTDIDSDQNQETTKAIIFTSGITAAIVLILMFVYLYRPNPLPSETIIELDLGGNPNAGGGSGGSMDPSPTPSSTNVPPATATENTEESPEVERPKADKVTPGANVNKPNNNTNRPTNPNAEFPGMSNDGSGGGNNGGDGKGEGGEKGDGKGTGTEPGTQGPFGDFVMEGRNLLSRPKINDRFTEEGKVVVNIWVDPSGTITRVSINESMSNTSSKDLHEIALKAAKKTKWSENKNAVGEQKGYIVYKFVLK